MPEQTIIIVDQKSRINGEIITSLSDDNITIEYALNAHDCLKIASEFMSCLIVINPEMLGIACLDLCVQLKTDLLTRDIPIIFIFEILDEDIMEEGYQTGIIDHIMMPCPDNELLLKFRAHIAQYAVLHGYKKKFTAMRQVVDNMNEVFSSLPLLESISKIRTGIDDNSVKLFDRMENIQIKMDEATKAVQETQFSLQFTDKLSQQVNELAKLLYKFNKSFSNFEDLDVDFSKMERSSSESVLQDQPDQHVDSLLDSLDL